MFVLPYPYLNSYTALAVRNNDVSEIELWKRRLAHMNRQDLTSVHKFSDGVPILKLMRNICQACRLGKAKNLLFMDSFVELRTSENLFILTLKEGWKILFLIIFNMLAPLWITIPDKLILDFWKITVLWLPAVQMTLTKFRSWQNEQAVNMEFSTNIINLHSDGAE